MYWYCKLSSVETNILVCWTEPTCVICSTLDPANFWWQDALWKLLFGCPMPVVSPAAWPWLTWVPYDIPHNCSSGTHQETVRFPLILFSPRLAHPLTPFIFLCLKLVKLLSRLHFFFFLHYDEQSYLFYFPLPINKN